MADLFSTLNPDAPECHATAYCDGGSRGNPGPAASGTVLFDESGKKLDQAGIYIGSTTNNVAEYKSLLLALELAKKHSITHLQTYMDSKLVVEQMNKRWKVKDPNMKVLYAKAKHATEGFTEVKFTHIRRERNTQADAIVNQVLNRQSGTR